MFTACSRPEIKIKILANSILLISTLLPCIGDWVLYNSLSGIEKGLVYGPIPQWKACLILAWSVVGTLFTVIKLFYHFTKLASSEKCCSLDCTSGCIYRWTSTLFDLFYDLIYQLPKIVLKLLVITCREEGLNVIICITSAIDLLSSFFPIFGLVLEFISFCNKDASAAGNVKPASNAKLCCCCNNDASTAGNVEPASNVKFYGCCYMYNYATAAGNDQQASNVKFYGCCNIYASAAVNDEPASNVKFYGCCNNYASAAKKDDENGRVKKCVNFLRSLVLLAIFSITITIIIYSLNFRSTSDGAILSKQKFNIYNKVYDMDRYFKNVGVFFAHPKLDSHWNYNFSHVDWIKLYPFYYEIFEEDIGLSSPECFPSKTLTHRIQFSDVPDTTIFYFKITYQEKNKVEYYKLDTSSKYIGTTNDYPEIEMYRSYTIIIKSDFISSDKSESRVFGRIRFNWKTLWPSGNCTSPNITIVDDDYKMKATKPYAIIQYFRERREVPAEHTFLKKEGSQVRFYNPKEDLEDIENVWRPGLGKCKSTGDLAPVFDTSLNVECWTTTCTCYFENSRSVVKYDGHVKSFLFFHDEWKLL